MSGQFNCSAIFKQTQIAPAIGRPLLHQATKERDSILQNVRHHRSCFDMKRGGKRVKSADIDLGCHQAAKLQSHHSLLDSSRSGTGRLDVSWTINFAAQARPKNQAAGNSENNELRDRHNEAAAPGADRDHLVHDFLGQVPWQNEQEI
jgi:hypothetical protein